MPWPAQILIVAQECPEREKVQRIFQTAGVRTFCCSTLLEAESFLSGHSVSAIFAETVLPDGDFRAVRSVVARSQSGVPIVALTWNMDWNTHLAAMGAGAFDCVSLPSNTMEVKRVLWAALQSFSTITPSKSVVA